MIAGFIGGAADTVIRIIADALLTVPAIAVLVVLAANVDKMTVEMMGVAIALLAWMFPTRVIRSQVLDDPRNGRMSRSPGRMASARWA